MKILNNSVVEFTLEQITSMVHFQGKEDGAGIRASDLKPRFDAFLQRYWCGCTTKDGKQDIKEYTLNKEAQNNNSESGNQYERQRESFDYKVKIINHKNVPVNFDDGKEVDDEAGKFVYASYYIKKRLRDDCKLKFYNDIKIEFISPHQYLRKQINCLFPIFLAVNGFGLGNNKGYGYFKRKGDNENKLIENIKTYQSLENEYIRQEGKNNKEKGIGIYQFEKKIEKRVQLEEIERFHKILKSGLNSKENDGKYIPSFMLKEAKVRKGVTREKKALKLFLKKENYDISSLTKKSDINNNDSFDNLEKEKIYYVRGLLGLPLFYEFRQVSAKFNIKIEDVDRFPSPLKYIPISDEKVIILVDYSKIEEFRNKVSNVEFVLKEKNKKEKKLCSKLPSEEEYSIHQLFKKDGIIMNNISGKEFDYSIISDIECER